MNSRTHTVWIKARPREHMAAVMEQGDCRPMAKNPEAMEPDPQSHLTRARDGGAKRQP